LFSDEKLVSFLLASLEAASISVNPFF